MSMNEELQAYIDATNTHDFSQVQKCLHPDAVYFFSDRTCRNHKEIRQYFETAWIAVENEKYAAQDVEWLHIGNTSASCTYTYVYEGYTEGKYVSGKGRATNVFIFGSAGWLLLHEHLSPMP